MKTFLSDDPKLNEMAAKLSEGKALAARGKKLTDEAKEFVEAWLKAERDLDVTTLPAKESVLIKVAGKDCLRIDRKDRPKMVASSMVNTVTYYEVL